MWSAPSLIAPEGDGDTLGVDSVSCASKTFCVAVGSYLDFAFDGSSWHGNQIPAQGIVEEASCVSTTFCGAVDASGYFYKYDGTSWDSGEQIAKTFVAGLHAVQCLSKSFCVAETGKRVLHFNGSSWNSQNVDSYDANIR